jgi:hypothetical protein
MSVYPNQTNFGPGNPYFIVDDNSVDIRSTINVYNGTINTSQINLDAIQMDCAYIGPASTPTLLLNGAPVAATSSFTSSVVTWASYPALNTITYAGAGGVANLASVNALTTVSTATVQAGTINATTAVNAGSLSTPTLTVSTINGAQFPSPQTAVLNVTGSVIVSGINTTNVDFTSLSAGFYLIVCLISTGGTDPFSCSATVRYSGGVTVGGCFHCPFLSGAAPTLNNCVSIQDNNAGGSIISVVVNTNSVVAIGAVPQISVYRLT